VFHGAPALNPVFDFSYDGVMRSLEESLERLAIGRVDILHIHDPDDHYDEALSGAYRALDELRQQGVIGAVGAGMNQAEMLTRFAKEADFDCFLLAGRYTLLDQVALKELLPTCLERGVAIIAGGVFNSGILADPRPGAHYNYQAAPQELIDRAQKLRAVCERRFSFPSAIRRCKPWSWAPGRSRKFATRSACSRSRSLPRCGRSSSRSSSWRNTRRHQGDSPGRRAPPFLGSGPARLSMDGPGARRDPAALRT